MHEAPEEICNTVGGDDEDEESESDDGFDEAGTDLKVDEDDLISKKSPYEQKFIREIRQLFSETLNPSRYLRCPPLRIKLRQALSSKLDPSLYRFRPR